MNNVDITLSFCFIEGDKGNNHYINFDKSIIMTRFENGNLNATNIRRVSILSVNGEKISWEYKGRSDWQAFSASVSKTIENKFSGRLIEDSILDDGHDKDSSDKRHPQLPQECDTREW